MRARLVGDIRKVVELPSVQCASRLVTTQGPAGITLDTTARIPELVGSNQVMVRVHGASINPLDVMMSRGYGNTMLGTLDSLKFKAQGMKNYPDQVCTLGRDFSGEVVCVGVGLTGGIPVGSTVWGATLPWGGSTHQQYVTVDASSLAVQPPSLDPVEAASIPFAALTAWSAIVTTAGISKDKQGARVLVMGAGGAVGGFAVQLLVRHFGAEVNCVASERTAEDVLRLGANTVLDYRDPQLDVRLGQMHKQDVILDCAGLGTQPQAIKTLQPLLRTRGRIVSLTSPVLNNTDNLGLVSGLVSSLSDLWCSNTSEGVMPGSVRWAYFYPDQGALKTIGRLVRQGKLWPPKVITRPFTEIVEAYTEVEQGLSPGKVVLDMRDS